MKSPGAQSRLPEASVDETSPFAVEDQTLDELLPRKVLGESTGFILTLRFLPAWHDPESQIVISQKDAGGYIVTFYHLPPGSKSIYQQAFAIHAESDNLKPAEIAKQIRVLVENVEVPQTLLARQLDRLDGIKLSPLEELDSHVAHLDADGYFFHADSGFVGPVGFSAFYGGKTYGNPPQKHPLVVWMEEMKAIVAQCSHKATGYGN